MILICRDAVITGRKGEEEKNKKKETDTKPIQKRILSFNPDDEEEDDSPPIPKKRVGMDPTVDTSFLPDKERESETIK